MNDTAWEVTPHTTSAPPDAPIDPRNPFENALENREYRMDYRRILPQILLPGFQIPLFPDKMERCAIRKNMNAVGIGAFFSTLIPQILFVVVELLVLAAMGVTAADSESESITSYLNQSSIMIALNALLFTGVNIIMALCGCKSLRIAPRTLFEGKWPRAGTLARYVLTGIGLQFAVGLVYLVIEQVFAEHGVVLEEADFSYFQTTKSTIAVFLYTCILAPIGEELLYRGFLMKALSRVGVRFGIVMSALLFGLAHGNVSQFLLGFLCGMFFGKIDARHNSLLPSIIMHIGINSVSLIINFLDVKATGEIGSMLTNCVVLLYYGIAIFGIVLGIWKERCEPMPFPTQKQITRNRVWWSSPWLWAALILHIGLFFLNAWANTAA